MFFAEPLNLCKIYYIHPADISQHRDLITMKYSLFVLAIVVLIGVSKYVIYKNINYRYLTIHVIHILVVVSRDDLFYIVSKNSLSYILICTCNL